VAHATNHVYASQTRATDDFNDRVLAVTQAELMAVVEPVVAAQMERDVKPYLATYAAQWGGRYPFPAAFASPSPGNSPNSTSTRPQSTYTGSAAEIAGLLPVANTTYAWTAGSGSVSHVSGTGLLTPGGCTLSGTAMQCDFSIVGTGFFLLLSDVRFRISAEVPNSGMSFASLPSTAGVTIMQCTALTINCTTPVTLANPAMSGSLSATGTGTVAYEATYNACLILCSIRFFRVTIPVPTASPFTDPAGTTAANWYITNEWYRQTYYAASTGNLPGGAGCVAGGTPACLTVNDLPSRYATSNDKQAVLILAGRSLNGAARPSPVPSDYLELENAVVDSVYRHRAGAPTAINDRVVVVAP
jgi:hypothetical protein